MLTNLKDHFQIDYYLPRSIVACLTPGDLKAIVGNEIVPVEVCCATLQFWIKTKTPDKIWYYQSYRYPLLTDGEQVRSQCDKVNNKLTDT